jgi:hypothetical protein
VALADRRPGGAPRLPPGSWRRRRSGTCGRRRPAREARAPQCAPARVPDAGTDRRPASRRRAPRSSGNVGHDHHDLSRSRLRSVT